MVESLTQDPGIADSSFTGVTRLCPRDRHFIPCLVLVQPREIHPNMTKKLLTGT